MAMVLLACSSTVKTNLASYGTPSDIPKGASIAVLPQDLKNAESLEFQHFTQRVKDKLREAGYKIVEPNQHPDLIAEFDYKAMPARQQTTYYDQHPAFGPFGGFGYGYGNRWGYRRYSYLGYSFPLGGDDYTERRSYSRTYYDRWASLILHKPAVTQRVYESKLEGSSVCGKLEPVLNAMIDRLFTRFPQQVQESQTIPLPDESC